jgi:hypothetical protein
MAATTASSPGKTVAVVANRARAFRHFDLPEVYGSGTIIELDRIPESPAVIEAGVIGAEYACTFAEPGYWWGSVSPRGRARPHRRPARDGLNLR